MVELVSLCGYYTLISYLLNAFTVPIPPGWWDAPARPRRSTSYLDVASESRSACACFLCNACALTPAQPAI